MIFNNLHMKFKTKKVGKSLSKSLIFVYLHHDKRLIFKHLNKFFIH